MCCQMRWPEHLEWSISLKYLLDTHIVLWWLSDLSKLNKESLSIIRDPNISACISIVSVLEVSIKTSIGKLSIDDGYVDILKKEGFEFLPVILEDADLIKNLPLIHKDPFDRLIIAQAINNDLTVITKDPFFKAYDIGVLEA